MCFVMRMMKIHLMFSFHAKSHKGFGGYGIGSWVSQRYLRLQLLSIFGIILMVFYVKRLIGGGLWGGAQSFGTYGSSEI